jgi:hypothetical protein
MQLGVSSRFGPPDGDGQQQLQQQGRREEQICDWRQHTRCFIFIKRLYPMLCNAKPLQSIPMQTRYIATSPPTWLLHLHHEAVDDVGAQLLSAVAQVGVHHLTPAHQKEKGLSGVHSP